MNNDKELRKSFKSLRTGQDVANLLEIEYKTLILYLYRRSSSYNYKVFNLHKKSGGKRKIVAPISPIKILQQKLNYILHLVYSPKVCVHGFVKNKNTLTNAQAHARQKIILNIDIKDFFPAINFGIVRGMFIARPYNIHPKAATILAQLCCVNNFLPQGAPTSPIISNMICGKLDNEFLRLAIKSKCIYTRYADDITISSYRTKLPKCIGEVEYDDYSSFSQVGSAVKDIIHNNGFIINDSKVRIQSDGKRKEVTGLLINHVPNVKRTYVRQLRAIFHAIKKFGLYRAEAEFFDKYYKKQKKSLSNVSLIKVIEGKLIYLKHVKGELDPVYRNLYNQYLQSLNKPKYYFTDPLVDIHDSLWILESEKTTQQGTAFNLRSYGLVTNWHVLRNDTRAYRYNRLNDKKKLSLIAKSEALDIAVLNLVDTSKDIYPSLHKGDSDSVTQGDNVTLAGFPNYNLGDRAYITKAQVASFRRVTTFNNFILNCSIVAGNSGGPVLDKNGFVIGIATRGAKNMDEALHTEDHRVVPINAIEHTLSTWE